MVRTKNRIRSKIKNRPRIKKKTRVTVDFPVDEHKRLKAIAALKGVTLQEFIITCVDEKMHTPNAKTIRILGETDEGKNLNECDDFEDLIRKLGEE